MTDGIDGDVLGLAGKPLMRQPPLDHNAAAAAGAQRIAELAPLLTDDERRFCDALAAGHPPLNAVTAVFTDISPEEAAGMLMALLGRPEVRAYAEATGGLMPLSMAATFLRALVRLEGLATKADATDRIKLEANTAVARLAGNAMADGMDLGKALSASGESEKPKGPRSLTAADIDDFSKILTG